jgi:hypothetical protein
MCNKYYWDGSGQANFGRDFKFSSRRTILSYIAEIGNDLLFSCLLDTGNLMPDSKDEDGKTPLSRTADKGREAVVKLLLETGKVDVNSTDNDGQTLGRHIGGMRLWSSCCSLLSFYSQFFSPDYERAFLITAFAFLPNGNLDVLASIVKTVDTVERSM